MASASRRFCDWDTILLSAAAYDTFNSGIIHSVTTSQEGVSLGPPKIAWPVFLRLSSLLFYSKIVHQEASLQDEVCKIHTY